MTNACLILGIDTYDDWKISRVGNIKVNHNRVIIREYITNLVGTVIVFSLR